MTLFARALIVVPVLSGHALAQGLFEPAMQATRSFRQIEDQELVDLDQDGVSELLIIHQGRPGLDVVRFDSQGTPVAFDWVGQDLGRFRSFTTLDLDGDGDLDVACLGYYSPSPSVEWLINVDGALHSGLVPAFDPPADGQVDLFARDFSGDGVPDLAISSWPTPPALVWYENLGGSFGTAGHPLIYENYTDLEILDVDGDAIEDLAYYSRSVQEVLVRRGDGSGQFLTPAFLTAALPGYVAPLALFRDIDLDGDPDLLTIHESELVVMEQVAPLVFQAPRVVLADRPSLSPLHGPRLEDFNADGALDLAVDVRDPVTGVVHSELYVGDGAGGWSTTPLLADGGITHDRSLVVDVSGDGRLDVLSQSATRLELLVGGQGTPISFDPARSFGTTLSNVDNVSLADVDRDGDEDFFCTSYDERSQVLLYRNEGGLRFGEAEVLIDVDADAVGTYISLVPGDFNGDGFVDLLLYFIPNQIEPGYIYLLAGDVSGSFTSSPVEVARAPGSFGYKFLGHVQDVDGDGTQDAFVGRTFDSSFGNSLELLANTGAGSQFTRVFVAGTPNAAIGVPAVVDVDGDGLLDVVSRGRTSLRWVKQISPRAFGWSVPLDPPWLTNGTQGAIAADWNGDGLRDLAVGSAPVATFIGTPGGPLSPPIFSPPTIGSCFGLRAAGDFTGDGLLDMLVMYCSNVDQAAVRQGDGFGRFVEAESIALPADLTGINAIAVGDLDLDGDLDFLSAPISLGGSHVEVYENRTIRSIGENGCGPAAVNSTGDSARVIAYGSTSATASALRLRAEGLPPHQFGLFFGSRTPRTRTAVPGSMGYICVGGVIGRYTAPHQVQSSGAGGRFEISIDPGQLIEGGAVVPATAGATWFFQAWFRDAPQGQATSNMTDALAILFD